MDTRLLKTICVAGLVVVLATFSDSAAQSQSRQVIVNGALMDSGQLDELDALNCGSPVADGQYWLDSNTGAWGHQDGPQEGVIGSDCAAAQPPEQNQQSDCESQYPIHEDRMCYCYHVC